LIEISVGFFLNVMRAGQLIEILKRTAISRSQLQRALLVTGAAVGDGW